MPHGVAGKQQTPQYSHRDEHIDVHVYGGITRVTSYGVVSVTCDKLMSSRRRRSE